MVCADVHESGQLAVSAGSRLERESIHAANLAQAAFKVIHEPERTLAHILVKKGVHVFKQTSDLFVNLGIVLHRTGAKGIETVVHAEIAAGKVGIVTNDIDFAKLGKFKLGIVPHAFGNGVGCFRYIQLRKVVSTPALMGAFKYKLIGLPHFTTSLSI